MERMQPFDLVVFIALLAMFVVGYAQGIIRRLLGIGAILFSIVLGAMLRQSVGDYLAKEWSTIIPAYSHMIAFGAVFFAAAVTLSLAIQMAYRPAPLLPRYPVLDEIIGGLLGLLEGVIILIAFALITDPYFRLPEVIGKAGIGEFGPLRTVHEQFDTSLTADVVRHNLVPPVLAVFGFLFSQDIRDAFASARRGIAAALSTRG
jgi:uncharacterized membrane protein required for colicin V production